jgi:hypothetical protein
MPNTIDDFPLEFRPRKLGPTVVLSIVILLELVFAAHFESQAKWPPEMFFTKGIITTLSFLFMVGACVWGIIDVQRKPDRVFLDDTGVIVFLNGVERRYRWMEIARFHKVLVHARAQVYMVAIERKGEVAFDARANAIIAKFGPPADELLRLLVAAKARWGGA